MAKTSIAIDQPRLNFDLHVWGVSHSEQKAICSMDVNSFVVTCPVIQGERSFTQEFAVSAFGHPKVHLGAEVQNPTLAMRNHTLVDNFNY